MYTNIIYYYRCELIGMTLYDLGKVKKIPTTI